MNIFLMLLIAFSIFDTIALYSMVSLSGKMSREEEKREIEYYLSNASH